MGGGRLGGAALLEEVVTRVGLGDYKASPTTSFSLCFLLVFDLVSLQIPAPALMPGHPSRLSTLWKSKLKVFSVGFLGHGTLLQQQKSLQSGKRKSEAPIQFT